MAVTAIADRCQFCAMPEGWFVDARPFGGGDRCDCRPPGPGKSGQEHEADCNNSCDYHSAKTASELYSMAYPGNDLRQLNARDFTVRLNRLLAQGL